MKRVLAVVGAALALLAAGCGGDPAADPPLTKPSVSMTPSDTPTVATLEAGVPVWWDEDGLHRGDEVERTAVRMPKFAAARSSVPHLALVRSGALYRQQNGDVWFHPWGGTPRVVGRGSAAGPGGDPEGDTAAWFDGQELVVYDTARDQVVSRSTELAAVSPSSEYVEHLGHGNGWVYVSSTQVVWRYPDGEETTGIGRRDLVSGFSELPWRPRPAQRRASAETAEFVDVSGVSAVWVAGRGYEGDGVYLVDQAKSRKTLRLPNLEYSGRLSPDGSWLLAPEIADGTHGVAFTDLDSGKAWRPFKKETYAFFSWAYGDVAVMTTGKRGGTAVRGQLVSCSATQRSCQELATRGRVVLPNP